MWWVALGINLERGRPGKPQDNGAHERMHLDISNELECCARANRSEQQASFDVWRHSFNDERPHESLGMKTPAEVYLPSETAYEGTPDDIAYEGKLSRRVKKNGCLKIRNRTIPISTALAGWSVGLLPDGNDHFDVYFANLRLGQIELSSAAFLLAPCSLPLLPPRIPTMISLLQTRLDEIADICRQHGVERLEVFGSATRPDFDPSCSDLDFIVKFAPPHDRGYADRYLGLAEQLERFLGRPVDLLTERSLRNPIFKQTIAAERQTIYAA